MTLSRRPYGGAVSHEDPFSIEYLSDPYPSHERLREMGEIVFLEKYGCFAMARHEQVSNAMRDAETFISSAGVGLEDLRDTKNAVYSRRLTLEIDPPEHGKYRRILMNILSPKAAKAMREEADRQAEILVSRIIDMRSFDLVKDLAQAFPMKVFFDAIGIRDDGREKFLDWARAVFNSWGPPEGIREITDKLGQECYPLIVESCAREKISPNGLAMSIYEAVDRGEIERACRKHFRSAQLSTERPRFHALLTFCSPKRCASRSF